MTRQVLLWNWKGLLSLATPQIYTGGFLDRGVRDRSLFIAQGGPEEKLGGPLKKFDCEKGGCLKNDKQEKRGAFENRFMFNSN